MNGKKTKIGSEFFGRGRFRLLPQYAILICLCAILASCNEGGVAERGDGNAPPSGLLRSLGIAIDDPDAAQGAGAGKRLAGMARGEAGDIASMTISVKDGSTDIVREQRLEKNSATGQWETVLKDIPIDVNLTFGVRARDDDGTTIFSGTTTRTLMPASDGSVPPVAIVLAVVDDGQKLTIPRITGIEKSATVYKGRTSPVRFSVKGSRGEKLRYGIRKDVSNDASGDGFTPASGSIQPVGATGTVTLCYTAPSQAGAYRYTFRLTNGQGNYVENDFTVEVAGSVPNTALAVRINPVVRNLGVKRENATLTWTADVTDDAPADRLRFAWKFNGRADLFENSAANPAAMTGYTDDTTGELLLTVTDRNGQGGGTSVSYTLPRNQFMADETPPVLTGYDPGEGSGDIDPSADNRILLRFGEPVDISGLTVADNSGDCADKTFALFRSGKDPSASCVGLGTPAHVAGSFGRSVAVAIAGSLRYGTVYRILLKKGAVSDLAGNGNSAYTARAGFETRSYPIIGELVRVEGGCFQMGNVFGEGNSNEKPVHKVCVEDFYLGKTEVTQGQWRKIMGGNPSHFKRGDDYPVEKVSWNDVQEFIEKLNERGNGRYRLPTEAEWEYACREGGKRVRYGTGKDAISSSEANYGRNLGRTAPVGSYSANALGLHDMSGNVWEWVSDWYGSDYYGSSPQNNPRGPKAGSLRVKRGGSWTTSPGYLRCANRNWCSPGYGGHTHLGFRLLRTF